MGIVLTVLYVVLSNRQAGLVAVAALLMPGAARAAVAAGAAEPAQAGVNVTAAGMFLVLVTGTLAITWWVVRRMRSSGWCRR